MFWCVTDYFFFLMFGRPPRSPLFPSPTLSRPLAVSAGLGATVAPRGPRATADLRLRYLDTAGVFATYEDAGLFGASAEPRSEEHTSELQSRQYLVCRLLLEKKKLPSDTLHHRA